MNLIKPVVCIPVDHEHIEMVQNAAECKYSVSSSSKLDIKLGLYRLGQYHVHILFLRIVSFL